MKFFIMQSFIILLILFTLCSCQTVESRGQYIDESLLFNWEKKSCTKSMVEDLIGTPTIIPDYTGNNWYYIYRSLIKRVWLKPKVTKQKIVKVSFDKNDIVENILVFNDSHNENIALIKKYTKTDGIKLNGLQKFIKNIGRFNKNIDKKAR